MLQNQTLYKAGQRLSSLGVILIRYGTVLILVAGGLSKWTANEAAGIQPMMAHQPLTSWLYRLANVQHTSEVIGVIELLIAILIATRRWHPKLSALGSLLGLPMFLITLGFFFTTPNLDDNSRGFLLKDFFLLGGCLITAAEALLAALREVTLDAPTLEQLMVGSK